MARQKSYVTEEGAAELEELGTEILRPKLSRRAAMVTPADEQLLRSLREALRVENAASEDLDELYDEFADEIERHGYPASPTGLATTRPRGRHELRAQQRAFAREAPKREGALVYGVDLGRYVGHVVELATRMYGDYDAPDLVAIVDFAERALREPTLLQSPTVRDGVTQARNAVAKAFESVSAVVKEISEVSSEQLARSDAGLATLRNARQLLIAAEYMMTWLLSEYAPATREEHERTTEGLEVFRTPEAERMRPMWRRPYGAAPAYARNVPGRRR